MKIFIIKKINFDGKDYFIKFDADSDCMVINDGVEFDEDSAREIGFYELEENYF